MSDRQTDSDAGRWMSYAQLAEIRGISKKAAQRLTLRHRWRRQPANDGGVLVWVPYAAAVPTRQTDRHDGGSDGHDVTAFETALAAIREAKDGEIATLRDMVGGLRDTVARAETRAVHAEQRATLAEARIGEAEQAARIATDALNVARRADEARTARGALRRAWDGLRGR